MKAGATAYDYAMKRNPQKDAAKIAGLLAAWVLVVVMDRVLAKRPLLFLVLLALAAMLLTCFLRFC